MYTSYYTQKKIDLSPDSGNIFHAIKYIVVDVDGTLTDGGIYYDESGNELKKFNTRDAAGFFTAKTCGISTMVITGRKCRATEIRMREMQVDLLAQGIVDKVKYIKEYLMNNNIDKSELAYIGDDLNDYSGMQLAGFKACPSDAAEEIKKIADYISPYAGGQGAFRDVIHFILKQRNQWEFACRACYHLMPQQSK